MLTGIKHTILWVASYAVVITLSSNGATAQHALSAETLTTECLIVGAHGGCEKPAIAYDAHAGVTFWLLEEIANASVLHDDAILEITRYSSGIRFSVGCNEVGYAFHANDTVLQVANMYSSSKRCHSNQLGPALIKTFNNTVHSIASYRISGNLLELMDAQGAPQMRLSRYAPAGIEVRRWFVESVFDGESLARPGGKLSMIPNFRPWITLLHGDVSGSLGCGGLVGTYALNGNELEIKATSILGGYCDPASEEVEHLVFPAVTGKHAVEQTGNRILLRDQDGKIKAVLAERP